MTLRLNDLNLQWIREAAAAENANRRLRAFMAVHEIYPFRSKDGLTSEFVYIGSGDALSDFVVPIWDGIRNGEIEVDDPEIKEIFGFDEVGDIIANVRGPIPDVNFRKAAPTLGGGDYQKFAFVGVLFTTKENRGLLVLVGKTIEEIRLDTIKGIVGNY